MAKEAGDYDFGTTAAHTHHSEEEGLRDGFSRPSLRRRKNFGGLITIAAKSFS